MLIAALAQGRPIMVIAMITAATIQATAIQSPPNGIQRMFSNSEKKEYGPPYRITSSVEPFRYPPPALPAGQGQHFPAKGHPLGNRIVFARFSGWLGDGAHTMNILWLIIIGFVAGIITKFLHPGSLSEPSGFILTTLLGIAGSFVATYL